MSRDPDKELLGGCLLAGSAALGVLLVPIIVCAIRGSQSTDIYTTSGLTRMFVMANLGSAIIAIPFSRRFGIAPAFGALGGYACGSAYWFMHIQQSIPKALAQTGQPTEYADSTMYVVPIAWLAIGFVTSLLPLYKNKRLNRVDS